MATRTKVLVVDSDLDILSKIYLALLHRNYKVEASNNIEEIIERSKRLKPALIILGEKEYSQLKDNLRTDLLVMVDRDTQIADGRHLSVIHRPVNIDALLKKVEEIVL